MIRSRTTFGAWLLLAFTASAAGEPTDHSSFAELLEYGLQHSPERATAASGARISELTAETTELGRLVPHVDLAASEQRSHYDRLYNLNGALVVNDGQNPAVSATVSYDLRKLFGPETELARQGVRYAKVQELITQRNVIRDIKKAYFTVKELEAETAFLKAQIGRYARLDSVLEKQRDLAVYNAIERQQFGAQRGLLHSDLSGRLMDLEKAYVLFASLLNVDVPRLKRWTAAIKVDPPLRYAGRKNLDEDALERLSDRDMTEELGRGFNLAKLEYDTFVRAPLPSVYIKVLREWPTMASSDGPRYGGEIGLSLPLDTWMTSASQRDLLGARADKARALMERAMLDYRAAVRSNASDLVRLQAEVKNVHAIERETDKLVDQAFLFYSQKRIDAVGTLDIFQKHVAATRALLQNDLQLQLIDAELERLLGGQVP